MENQKDDTKKPESKPDQTFWNNHYDAHTTRWDLGQVSPPLKAYFDQLNNKNLRILIPGCGNTYEAEYLLQQGFTNITVIDIAATLIKKLKNRLADNPNIKIILGDFFQRYGEYDLIVEQTFFCAIDRELRKAYVVKMKELLATNGKLVGVLFDKEFEQKGPPFGGSKNEYISLFKNDFNFLILAPCYNSFYKRLGTELFFIVQKLLKD